MNEIFDILETLRINFEQLELIQNHLKNILETGFDLSDLSALLEKREALLKQLSKGQKELEEFSDLYPLENSDTVQKKMEEVYLLQNRLIPAEISLLRLLELKQRYLNQPQSYQQPPFGRPGYDITG